MTSENITRVGKRGAHVSVKKREKNVKIIFLHDKGQQNEFVLSTKSYYFLFVTFLIIKNKDDSSKSIANLSIKNEKKWKNTV